MKIGNPDGQMPREEAERNLLLENAAFKRFANGFEIYQKLLREESVPEKRDEIVQRMHSFYTPHQELIDDEQKKVCGDAFQTINMALDECEKGMFSPDQLAQSMVENNIANLFLKEWNKTAGDFDEDLGMTYANETVAYTQDHNAISIHIRPTAAEGPDLMRSVLEGLKEVSIGLREGTIHADKVFMKSWLLGTSLEKKVKKMFGENINLRNTDPSDQDLATTRHLAVQYNKRSMEAYLRTGEMPEVREMKMNKDEFVAQIEKL